MKVCMEVSNLNFINWDKELKSIAFLFEFIERLDLDLYEKVSVRVCTIEITFTMSKRQAVH